MQRLIIKDFKLQSLNNVYRKHWTKRAKDRDDAKWLLKQAIKKWDIKPVKKYPIELQFIIYVKDKRKYDVDNFAVKDLIDGLVDNKILKDDSDKYIYRISKEIRRGDENWVDIIIYQGITLPYYSIMGCD